jgi:hypothetical protein
VAAFDCIRGVAGVGRCVGGGRRASARLVDTLTPAEAANVGGVPTAQLLRWAWEDWDVYEKRAGGRIGPRNVGTRRKPLYLERDVRQWRDGHERVNAQDHHPR